MKTLIVYATKHGATAKIAQHISENIQNSTLCDLKEGKVPNIQEFDCIIIGSSIYAGSARKEAKKFVAENANTLCQKRVGLFLSAMSAKEEECNTYFEKNFDAKVLQTAKAKAALGAVTDPQKMNALERFIIKAVTKSKDYKNTIDAEKIKQFAKDMIGE